uniref:Choline transporter-like protein n=1 Tax=Pygocentrus nattereri TaxID=42514 RepID=A0AAR2JP55_PYGNA
MVTTTLKDKAGQSCTDIICCVLFMLVITGYMVVGILAWLYGDPRHVLYPRNSTGMYCGIAPNHDKPNVFYFNILQCATATNIMAAALQGLQCPTTQPCSSSHRPAALSSLTVYRRLVAQESVLLFSGVSLVLMTVTLITLTLQPPPTSLSLSDMMNSFNARDVGVRIFADFASTWQWIVLGLVIAMLASLLFLLLLRFLAAILVWVLIIGVLAVGAFGIWYCYNEYTLLANSPVTYNNVGFTTNVNVYLQIRDTWLAFLIILCVVEGLLLLILIFLRTRILIAIALIKESSKAVGYMMSTLCYPIVTFVLLLVCVSYWGITALYLATSGAPVYNVVALNASQGDCRSITGNQTCDPLAFNSTLYPTCPSARCVFIKYNTEAFASYYWAFHKPADIPACPLVSSFMRALRYHVGSLAFGALILTIIQVVRIILEYIDHKCRAAQNPCGRFLMCCLKCCFWCLEKFIKFLNRNAYIMIAIYGKNFCVSAKNAFLLLMRNILRVVVLDKVTDLLLFFGKLLVVGGIGVLAFFFFSGKIQVPGSLFRASELNYYWMPIITVVVGAYLITHGFFSVYNMCVDTLFLCFLEDLERNDGSAEKPYYMSKNLMKILNKKNKQPKK